MRRSTNYNFYLPENSDYRDVSQLNYNFEQIDTLIKNINNNMDLIDPTNAAWLANVDANNYKTTGTYPMSNGCSNLPGTWGILCVSAPRSDILYQTFANDGGFFWREYNSSVSPNWKSWRKLNDESYIAIVTNGNTAPIAISKGKYVIWNAGLYVANAPISSGGTLSTSNLDAVAEGGLNGILSRITPVSILDTLYTLSTTATSYSCSWSGYKILIITYGNYGNIWVSNIVPVSEFAQSSDGRRTFLYYSATDYVEVYKNGDNAVYVLGHGTLTNNKVRIWGVG